MSGSDGMWNAQATSVDDPLASYRKKPVISHAGANATYKGRVIIEMWDDASLSDDASRIAIVADAADGGHAALLERVSVALAQRLQRGNPLRES